MLSLLTTLMVVTAFLLQYVHFLCFSLISFMCWLIFLSGWEHLSHHIECGWSVIRQALKDSFFGVSLGGVFLGKGVMWEGGILHVQLEREWKMGAELEWGAAWRRCSALQLGGGVGGAHSQRPPPIWAALLSRISSVSSTLYKTFWAAARAPSGRTTLGGEGRDRSCTSWKSLGV